MKYLLLLASDPADEPAPDSEAFGPYMGEWAHKTPSSKRRRGGQSMECLSDRVPG